MAKEIQGTSHGDAPLSSAHHPDPEALAADIDARKGDVVIGRTVTINRSREDLYRFWRDFRNLPRFMENIERVTVQDDDHSHWVVAAPGGSTVEWDSAITEDVPNERISWTSLEGASVRNSGSVQFYDSSNHRGTRVTVTIAYDPPAGAIGRLVAKLFQREPKIQSRQDLRRFKQLMETGEVATARMRNVP